MEFDVSKLVWTRPPKTYSVEQNRIAITTTAGIVAPLLPVLGLSSPALACLTVIAIGAGAMTVSHANDSYFWVVTNFGEMTPQDGYKTQTLGTLVIGVVSIIGVFIVSLFMH